MRNENIFLKQLQNNTNLTTANVSNTSATSDVYINLDAIHILGEVHVNRIPEQSHQTGHVEIGTSNESERERERDRQTDRQTDREREREREREKDRQTDRQTDRERETERE